MPKIKKKAYASKRRPEEEIRSIVHHVAEFVAARRKQALITASVVLALIVVFSAHALVQSGRDKKASQLLPAALEYYSPAKGVPPDYAKALELYRDIGNKYSGTMSGAVARYYAGNCLVALGRRDEAVAEYRKFLDDYSGHKFLSALVCQRLGYVYADLGNQAEAVKAFERAEALAGPGLATVELARLYERSGKTAEAEKKYKEITEKLPGTRWAFEAMTKVQKPGISPKAPSASPAAEKPAQK